MGKGKKKDKQPDSGVKSSEQSTAATQQQQPSRGSTASQGPPGIQGQNPPGLQTQGPPGFQAQGPPGIQGQGPPGLQTQGPPGFQAQGPPRVQEQSQQKHEKKEDTDKAKPDKGAWKKDKKKGQESVQPPVVTKVQQPPLQTQQPPITHPQQPPVQVSAQVKQNVPASMESTGQPQPKSKGDWKKDKKGQQKGQGEQQAPMQAQDQPSGARPKQAPPSSQQKPQMSQQGGPPSSDITSSMQSLAISPLSPVREPVRSKNMLYKRILTNYLKLDLSKLPNIVIHYDITIIPDTPKKFMWPAFHKFIEVHQPEFKNKIAFDGRKNCYTTKPMKEGEFGQVTVPSPDGGKDKQFKISIKKAENGEINMRCLRDPTIDTGVHIQKAIQALDIVLRSAHDKDKLVKHKRSVFAPPETRLPMQDNYELWIGLYQSFVLGAAPYLNVDVSHKAFPSGGSVLKLYDQYQRNLSNVLSGLTVVYVSPMTGGRTSYGFRSVGPPADVATFKDDSDGGKQKTIAQYFAEKKKPLKYPKHPVLNVGTRNTLLPIEFLEVPSGQALNRKAPESCTRDMVKYAATSTDERKRKIENLLKNMNYNRVETIKHFGLTVGENFIEVDSHILNAPGLEYANRRVVRPVDGVWRAETEQMLAGEKCIKWGILNMSFKIRDHLIDQFSNLFMKIANTANVEFAPFKREYLKVYTDRQFDKRKLDNIINELKKNEIQLLFVIIPGFGDMYHEVKKSAELRCGMLTQCIKDGTIERRMDGSTLSNILLKVNSKLGGTNHKINVQSQVKSINGRPFMVIGADVTHPSPEQRNIPSVVGVAASYDPNAFRYNCQWRIQSPREEMIQDLEQIITHHLNIFKDKHKILPLHLLYYRDGVSDGQFEQVRSIELNAIMRACARIQQDYKPKITFIVVQKRHHTRFFPRPNDPNPKDRKNNNVIPGTCVDSEITDPTKWQFFLVSHKSIQGVAKPTKYCVLFDDAGISNEDLQNFTYNMCHMFTRCNRTVSYVAPTYYAHLVAYRGRVYIHNERIECNLLENFQGRERENQNRAVKDEIIKGRPMFFV